MFWCYHWLKDNNLWIGNGNIVHSITVIPLFHSSCISLSVGQEYTYSIEKIYIKELKRDEVRFCVYKATRRGDETYIPRSLDVTELELIELIKEAIREKVFSEGFIEILKQEINKI